MIRISDITKLKALKSSVESLSCQFQQRCSVSRTAKGKGKIKAGQTLKQSKVSTKKGSADASPKGGGGKFDSRDPDGNLEQLCLNAPTPLRHLSPKRRQREAEREKLGLINEGRKRDIEMLKKQAKEGSIKESRTIIRTPGLYMILLGLVDAEDIPKYELTVEDGRRLAKEYCRVVRKWHRASQAAESTLLKLKKEAIKALPEHLKAAALVPDLTPFPAHRFMATLTLPIEEYIEKVEEAAKKSSAKEKLR